MVELSIDEVYPKNKMCPVLVNFRNGYTNENFEERECAFLEHKISGKRSIATEINHYVYTGDICEEPLTKTFLVARNRKTGKVRIIEVDTAEVQPIIKSDVEREAVETSFVDLGRKFGSKKYKKMLEQNEKLKVSEEVVAEQLQNVSHNVTQDQLDVSTFNKTDTEDFYLPAINRDAVSIEDVYPLNGILSDHQYDTAYSEIEGKDFIKELYPCIREIYSEKWDKKKFVLAVYASSLFKMNHLLMPQIRKKSFTPCPYSQTLNDVMLKEFFGQANTGRIRPNHYKDKALCHAIVFMFLINNYKLDIESLTKHLKLVERTVTLKINMTGGHIVKQGTKKIAVLKLPLNKASSTFARRRTAKF